MKRKRPPARCGWPLKSDDPVKPLLLRERVGELAHLRVPDIADERLRPGIPGEGAGGLDGDDGQRPCGGRVDRLLQVAGVIDGAPRHDRAREAERAVRVVLPILQRQGERRLATRRRAHVLGVGELRRSGCCRGGSHGDRFRAGGNALGVCRHWDGHQHGRNASDKACKHLYVLLHKGILPG